MEASKKQMKIKLKVRPNSSQEKIVKINGNELEIWVKEKPINGKASYKAEKMLKKYFKKDVKIVSGFKGRNKIIEIK